MRLVLPLLALLLVGCESTQSKSARLEAAARGAEREQGLVVGEASRDVEVVGTTVLADANGAAAVVELRNRTRGALVGIPLALTVRDAAGETAYANDAPGLDAALVGVAALGGRESLAWVNDQVTLAEPGGAAEAVVGADAEPGPPSLPEIEISGLKPDADASGDVAIAGTVTNRSEIEQRQLSIFVVGRRDGEIVTAGRAVVEKLAPGASAQFAAFPIGDPTGAELTAAAPPTVTTP